MLVGKKDFLRKNIKYRKSRVLKAVRPPDTGLAFIKFAQVAVDFRNPLTKEVCATLAPTGFYQYTGTIALLIAIFVPHLSPLAHARRWLKHRCTRVTLVG